MLSSVDMAFSTRTRKGFTGSVGRTQGASFIMMNAKAIPCTPAGFEGGRDVYVGNFAVVGVHAEGLARAPFKYNDKSKTKKETKPLTAMAADGGMQFWSYVKKGSDKGDRMEDLTWSIRPGSTFKFFFRGEDCGKVFPIGLESIPAHTLCEVVLVPKSSEPCAEGWGFNVRTVRPSTLSLYSYIDNLSSFSPTREEARRAMLIMADQQQPIRRIIDNESPCFSPVYVSVSAYTQHVPESSLVKIWKLVENDPSSCVDMDESTLLKYTNSTTVEAAMRLLEIAIACSALRILVFTSEFRAKTAGLAECFGVPVIDTEKLFACVSSDVTDNGVDGVDGGSDYASFLVLQNCSQFTDFKQSLFLRVFPEQRLGESTESPITRDCIITSCGDQCTTSCEVHFVLESGVVLWKGFFNTSPVEMVCAGGICPQRRKWSSLQ